MGISNTATTLSSGTAWCQLPPWLSERRITPIEYSFFGNRQPPGISEVLTLANSQHGLVLASAIW